MSFSKACLILMLIFVPSIASANLLYNNSFEEAWDAPYENIPYAYWFWGGEAGVNFNYYTNDATGAADGDDYISIKNADDSGWYFDEAIGPDIVQPNTEYYFGVYAKGPIGSLIRLKVQWNSGSGGQGRTTTSFDVFIGVDDEWTYYEVSGISLPDTQYIDWVVQLVSPGVEVFFDDGYLDDEPRYDTTYNGVIYVDRNASGAGDGSSWEDAFNYLQDAIDDADPITEIWVAAGTYRPSFDYGLGIGDRGNHFRMENGMAIYGGFDGTEMMLSQRDAATNKTILSGDIGVLGDDSDNSCHVFYNSAGTNLDETAILDGVTISGGNANIAGHYSGSGMYNYYSSPTITDCTFINCSSDGSGGGMYNDDYSSPTLTNCKFLGNSADYLGGGMLNYNSSSPVITNCIFSGNSADRGGGMFNYNYSDPIVSECTLSGNWAVSMGGGMDNYAICNPILSNCIFWDNEAPVGSEISVTNLIRMIVDHCDVQGGLAGVYDNDVYNTIYWDAGNISVTPGFVDADGADDIAGTDDDDLRLQASSPCLDAGDNASVTTVTDITGSTRIIDGDNNGVAVVDIGAYELRIPIDPSAYPVCLPGTAGDLGSTSSPALTVTVNLASSEQTITGFGASDAWSTQFVGQWASAKKEGIANLLFETTLDENYNPQGIGLSAWRFNLGAGSSRQSNIGDEWRRADTFLNSSYTGYDWDRLPGQRWFLQAAADRGTTKFTAFVNSPPINMTKNGNAYCDSSSGTTNLKDDKADDFGVYLATILDHFSSVEGIDFDYISPVNEPEWSWEGGQEGCRYDRSDITWAVDNVYAKLQAAGVATEIEVLDSGEVKNLYGTSGYDFIDGLFNSSSPDYVGDKVVNTITGHSYWSAMSWEIVSERQTLRNKLDQYPDLDYSMTEYCIMEEGGYGRDLGIDPALYIARVMHFDLTIADAVSWDWWLAVSPYNYKDGLVYIDKNKADGNYYDSKMLWAMGNYSRFVRPGMKRVNVQRSDGASDDDTVDDIMVSSYYDSASGTVATVFINWTGSSKLVELNYSNMPADKTIEMIIPYVTSSSDDLEAYNALYVGETISIPKRSIVTLVSLTTASDGECGDGICDLGEDACNCSSDCGTPPSTETTCDNGNDDDCDGDIDCEDSDCASDLACFVGNIIDPSDTYIQYFGRWNFDNPSEPWVAWKGSSIKVKFEGTAIVGTFNPGSSEEQYRVIIDGVPNSDRLSMDGGETKTYMLASGLAYGEHVVEIMKETFYGSESTFYGFEIAGDIMSPPARPSMKIEFFGDSNMDGTSLYSEQDGGDHGSYYAFPATLSRMLGAEFNDQSVGGATIDANGDNDVRSFIFSEDYYSQDYSYRSGFNPDVIVINAGANDIYGADKDTIKDRYKDMISDLRYVYGAGPHIVLFNAYGWEPMEPAMYTHEVVSEVGGNLSACLYPWMWEQWHGSMIDHAGEANILADHILSLGLSFTKVQESEIFDSFGRNFDVANGSFEGSGMSDFDAFGWRYYDDPGVDRVYDPGDAYDGNYYLSLTHMTSGSNHGSVQQGTDATGDFLPGPTASTQLYYVNLAMRGTPGAQAEIIAEYQVQQAYGRTGTPDVQTFSLTGNWEEYTVVLSAPVGIWQTFIKLRASNGTVDFDAVRMSDSPSGIAGTSGDGTYGFSDLLNIAENWLGSDPSGDYYTDGTVDYKDLSVIGGGWMP